MLLVSRAFALTDAPSDTYLRYDGEARAADGGALLYRERHVLHSRDGVLADRIVVYDCPDGRPFARKTLKYAPSALAPDLRFDDARSGVSYVLDTTSRGRRLLSRDHAGAKTTESVVPSDPALVADAGFDEYIRRSWQPLMTDAPLAFDILLLSDGSVLKLKARHLHHAQLAGEEVEVFRVALPGLLGLIAPNVDVTYASSGRVLRRFEGLSNIRDERGRQTKVVIDFPASAREAVTAAAWHEALAPPLVASCGG